MSVKQRPPTRSLASRKASLRPVGAMRRAAAIPAAPAPTMTTSTSGRGAGAASAGRAATPAEAARNERAAPRAPAGSPGRGQAAAQSGVNPADYRTIATKFGEEDIRQPCL